MTTETKLQHTPTPWRVAPDEPLIVETIGGKEIADLSLHNATIPSVENAAFIVRAVNCHQEQFNLIEKMGTAITDMFEQMEMCNWVGDHESPAKLNVKMIALVDIVKEAIELRKAIAKATESK